MVSDTRWCAVMSRTWLTVFYVLALVAFLLPILVLTDISVQEDSEALFKEELLLPVAKPVSKFTAKTTARPRLQDSVLRYQQNQQYPPMDATTTNPKTLSQLTTHKTDDDTDLSDMLQGDDLLEVDRTLIHRFRRRVPDLSGSDPVELRSVAVSLTVDLPFTAALADITSPAFIALAFDSETALNQYYRNKVDGYQSLNVTSFQAGALIINHDVTFWSINDVNRSSLGVTVYSLQSKGFITINNTVARIIGDATIDDANNTYADSADKVAAICYTCGFQTCVQTSSGMYACRSTDLYASGFQQGDTVLSPGDHVSSSAIQFPAGIPVGDRLFITSYVSTNGIVSFGSLYNSISPRTMPVPGISMVAPFWTDLDTSGTQVFNTYISYRLYVRGAEGSASAVLQQANVDVTTFEDVSTYNAAYVLVATWKNVPPYPASQHASEASTFQAAIISDGQSSYGRVQFQQGRMNFDLTKRRKFSVGYSTNRQSATFFHNQYDASVDSVLGNKGVRGLWFFKLGELSNSAMRCYEWYWRNLPDQANLRRMERSLLRCPCSATQVAFDNRWTLFSTDGTIVCYIRNNRRKYTKTCCYQEFALDTAPPNAGSLLVNNPSTDSALYLEENVNPKSYCCRESKLCDLYYAVRPPEGNCRRQPAARFARGMGDPHIGVLDGGTYAFNGWGEYRMMVLKDAGGATLVEVQARTCQAEASNNSTVNATVFCAFAARDQDDARFHVELNAATTGMVVYVNRQDVTRTFNTNVNYMYTAGEDNPFIQVYRENSSIVATFTSGVTLRVEPGIRQLVISLGVPTEFANMTSGLVGNFNGVQGDDYVFPNGTVQRDVTERGLFAFGQAWRIQPGNDSVFFYHPGYDTSSYQHPDFVPLFLDEVDNATRVGAESVCNTDISCIYDYIATNDRRFALATTTTIQQLNKQDALNANTAPTINGSSRIEVTLNQLNTFVVTAQDAETASPSYVTLEQPSSNYNFNSSSGTISWQPNNTNSTVIRINVIDDQGVASDIYDPLIVMCDGCSNHGRCNFSNPRTPDPSRPNFQLATCECYVGYSGDSCQIDTDGCALGPCLAGQNCTDLTPAQEMAQNVSYNCSSACPTGYQYNATAAKCEDINECRLTVAEGGCDQLCQNFVGSYRCSCESGYRRNGVCADINECVENLSDCDHLCTNTPGNYSCSCFAGFTLSSDGRTCNKSQAADPCGGQPSCGFACIVQNGTAKCVCPTGFQLAADNRACQDVNECNLNLCSQTCTNNNGSYTCSCYAGFQLSSDRQSCTVCEEGRWGVECQNQCDCRGRATSCNPVTGCVCQVGFTGVNCATDIDECVTNPGICGADKTCKNTVGSYTCLCPSGYTLASNGSCMDINECQTANTCEKLCINTPGSYVCACNAGYTAINSTHCDDVNECAAHTSGCEQRCLNLLGSYNCLCEFGFVLNADRLTCSLDANPCASLPSSPNCSYGCRVDSSNNPICYCQLGYELSSDNTTCTDINECASNSTNRCTQTCNNTQGSYNCSCNPGFSLANDKRTCQQCDSSHWGVNCANLCSCSSLGTQRCDAVAGCQCKAGYKGNLCDTDVDECATNNGSCAGNVRCNNTFGSFVCTCDTGYTLAPNQSYCLNVNECAQTPAPCDQNCTDTQGSYTCGCNSGFKLQPDGKTCSDIDECNSTNGGCNQRCRNTLGGFVCECNSGYTLGTDRRTCIDVDECLQTPAPCDQVCNNSAGNYSCSCKSGYTLQSDGRTCTDVDECAINNGNCSHTCNNTVGSYFCQCPANYFLGSDNRTCQATLVRRMRITLQRTVNSSVLNNPSSAEYKALVQDISVALESFFRTHITSVFYIGSISLSSGSVVVDAAISIPSGTNNNSIEEFSKALSEMAKQGYLTVNGTNTTLTRIVYDGNNITSSMSACDVLAVVSPCPSNQRCELLNNVPTCQDIAVDSNLPLILGLALGLPLFFILLAVIITTVILCLRRRNRQRHRTLYAHEPSEADRYGRSIFASGMPTKGSFGARQYGLYNPDTLSEAASQVSGSSGGGGQRLRGKDYAPRRLYDDDQPWYDNRPSARRDAAYEPEQPASNFSWDHMFRILEPIGNLKIQRPNVTATPRPAFTSSETPRRPFYSDA